MKKIRVIVCDYDNPKGYTFPSFGFGSSEKRIWHFAKTLSEIDGYEVIITGPLWLPEHVPNAKYFPERLNADSYKRFINIFGECDYLFAGHEYFDKDEWVKPFEHCAKILISYQLHPYEYKKISFNRKDKFLFCYSNEMVDQYANQRPLKAVLFHSGVNEKPFYTKNKKEKYAIWIGRLDRDKAPHYAIEAAKMVGIKIKILGKSVYQPDYYKEFEYFFKQSHVEMMGVLFGEEKMRVISEALCALYTIDKDYVEAGAGVLGEILSCGVPIAGMSWTGTDAVCEAVDDPRLGKIIVLNKNTSESEVANKLGECLLECQELNTEKTYELGSRKYDPELLIKNLFALIDQYK